MRVVILLGLALPMMAAADCHDSSSWYKMGETEKDCSWVDTFSSQRCDAKGHSGSYAFEVCHGACGGCDRACTDSDTWHVAGDESQDCAWVAGSTNRCKETGDDGTFGYESCADACGTCNSDMSSGDDADADGSSDGGGTSSTSSAEYKVYYQGSRQACLNEVETGSHCPDAFPSWPEANETNPECPLAVIGAGVGGLYTAMRLIDEGVVAGTDICVFEATERVGGRTYSLRYEDMNLVVDAGAYRTWPEFTPVLHTLITEYLGINMTCYDPSEVPCEKYIIVDEETGHNLGFTHYIETIMDRVMDTGARWFPWHYLNKISPEDDGTLELTFSGGATATVPSRDSASGVAGGGLILNTPQRPLLEILRASASTLDLGADVFTAAHAVQTAVVTKLYLYYPNAWWRSLGLTTGSFSLTGDAVDMALNGRYHDGDVVCEDDDEDSCSGFLLTVYTNDYSGNLAQYFRRYQRDRPEPITVISDSTVEGAAFLEHAHDRLTTFHIYENSPTPYATFEATQVLEDSGPPKFAVLSTWNTAAFGSGGGWHGFHEDDNVDAMPEILSDDWGIHIINEAYSKVQSWAEGSLEVADAILESQYGIARPWDFPAADVPLHLAQTSSESCEAEDEDPDSSAGDDGGSGGGSAVIDDELACFLADTLVATVVDGGVVMTPISSVTKGDVVVGAGGVEAVVTDVLVHPIDATVPVVVFGGIVGSLTHPVLVDGDWVAFETVGRVETRFVDNFYNLEIDAHAPGSESQHAYLLDGGVLASGLADNVELNMRFPRQNGWKERVAAVAK